MNFQSWSTSAIQKKRFTKRNKDKLVIDFLGLLSGCKYILMVVDWIVLAKRRRKSEGRYKCYGHSVAEKFEENDQVRHETWD